MANKLNYKVVRFQSSGGYEHVAIDLLPGVSGYRSPGPLVTFTWQSHYDAGTGEDSGWKDWYGFHIQLDSCNSLEDLEAATRLARRVLKAPEQRRREWSPEEILERLDALKAVHVVYDCRVNRCVPASEVASPELRAWFDDHIALGNKFCTVSILAATREQAQTLIVQELFSCGYEKILVAFIQAGKPVKMRDDHAPDTTPAQQLIQL